MRHPILFTTLLSPLVLHVSHAQTGGNLSNCKGGCDLGEVCIGNPFSQPVTDAQCNKCAGGQYWWPCNFETLCFCNSIEENAPRAPPAPKSRIKVNELLDPCRDILTEEVFDAIVQPMSEEGKALFTYSGLCNAIAQYNILHDEKFANMGSDVQMRAELAAFLAHTAVDTHGFSVTREEFHCVDPIMGSDGNAYCKPCKEEHYDSGTMTCSQHYFVSEESYKEYCDITRQAPQGCGCDKESVKPVFVPVPVNTNASNVDTNGYIPASDAYFTRGSIQISWNYDYYGASLSMTGNGDILCDNPDLVATNPAYAWGVGLYKWMEKMTFGTMGETAHRQALKMNFGGTVKALYGELECPSNKWDSISHVDMVHDRVAQVCKAGAALGVYLEMDKCETKRDCLECDGLRKIYDSCQELGTCPHCASWVDFVRSVAPTVTPIRIKSPTFDDWNQNYQDRSAADVKALPWTAVTLVFIPLYLAGSLFSTI
mmetsp:Transcript_29759/g.56286  ORF Transcript_29759/g.56286 Transcript_29759/m.56286 type:complete len:484 (+) Transcript_29759:161-1612(+)